MTLLSSMRVSALTLIFGLITAQAQNAPVNPAQPAPLAAGVIERIEFAGANRVPEDALRALVPSKAGDVYDEEAIRRGFTGLWNTSRFDDIRVSTEKGDRGGIVVRFIMTERPQQALPPLASNVIEGIEFRGINRVSEETMKATVLSKIGEVYDEQTMRRNFMALWNTGRFDDVQVKTDKGERGGIVLRFVVTERP